MAVLARAALLAAACLCAASGLSLWSDDGEHGAEGAEVELRVDAASCAAQLEADSSFMEHVVKEVGMGNYSGEASAAWHAYQDKLAHQLLSEHPDGQRKKPYKILVVSAVHDTDSMVEIFEVNMNRLLANKQGDKFEFAIFHIDSKATEWKKRKWYRRRRGPVVMKKHGAGCKPQFWAQITPMMVATGKYDYVWLLDEDIRLDFLNWDFYRTVLSTVDPLVSQPVIVPKQPGKRSTGVTKLQMKVPEGNNFMIAYETQRSEVQAPIISSKIWDAVHERNIRERPPERLVHRRLLGRHRVPRRGPVPEDRGACCERRPRAAHGLPQPLQGHQVRRGLRRGRRQLPGGQQHGGVAGARGAEGRGLRRAQRLGKDLRRQGHPRVPHGALGEEPQEDLARPAVGAGPGRQPSPLRRASSSPSPLCRSSARALGTARACALFSLASPRASLSRPQIDVSRPRGPKRAPRGRRRGEASPLRVMPNSPSRCGLFATRRGPDVLLLFWPLALGCLAGIARRAAGQSSTARQL
ncbi:unnamed protein product [Prorocentrum cordatum]|uniref:Ceramide glucosyltransferase n=1 Tax=Prorocentrum cordatum TaxID=2364126 RepID=A0ABN9QD12_9DINO|nr:unnamed protein product [Polarella glacialis]